MGSVVFQAPSGGSTSLVGTDTASPLSITVPAVNGILLVASSTTSALPMPAGTTAERPGTPATGETRFNTTTGYLETYNGSIWTTVGAAYGISALVIGGGGNGDASAFTDRGGGGGAGGFVTGSNIALKKGTTYTIVIGV